VGDLKMKYLMNFTISLILALFGALIGLQILRYMGLDGNQILRLVFVMTGSLTFYYLAKYFLKRILK
jgi:hypothetical protein|tara:strand:+ start:883 stop:1083 length:201 start_codon:yes stop_codon:yes gene_type:complete